MNCIQLFLKKKKKWIQYFYSTNIETLNKMGSEMQVSIINEMKMIKKDEKIEKNIQSFVIFEGSPVLNEFKQRYQLYFPVQR